MERKVSKCDASSPDKQTYMIYSLEYFILTHVTFSQSVKAFFFYIGFRNVGQSARSLVEAWILDQSECVEKQLASMSDKHSHLLWWGLFLQSITSTYWGDNQYNSNMP